MTGNITSTMQISEHHWKLESDEQQVLDIHILGQNIFRFRWNPEEQDFSYAIDPAFSPIKVRVEVQDNQDGFQLSTADIHCRVSRHGMRIQLSTNDGKLINADQQPFQKKGESVSLSKAIQPGEAFFGLGDKADDFNLRGKKFENWGTDAFYYQRGTDPLYRNIPFYVGLHDGIAYGIFLDNSHRTHFDFGKSHQQRVDISADGGELNYYFIHGPQIQRVVETYVLLTGRPELPPLWGLGYHQCKWSYFPESNVKEIAAQFRKLEIPCDAIYLDIDYMDGYRCFTWNKEAFPDPARMISELRDDGFKTVVILDPGIKIDENYEVYQEGLKGDFFCKTSDGKVFEGEVWPGPCHFPDFTKAAARGWWQAQVKKIVDAGVAGIWNDMNEPSVFDSGNNTMPPDVQHDYDGEQASHARGHNVYGMQMARATFEGLKKWRPDHRPFVITRSGYSGLQRYTLVWTGDNTSTWEQLWLASIQCQRMSISGVSFVGTDIGGFIKDSDPELFVRWIQLGAFHPLFRTHSMADKADQAPNLDEELREAIRGGANREPWTFGEAENLIIKKHINLRYQLLPYLYTAFWQYVQAGTPILRPLIMLDQEHSHFAENAENFAVGDHLIVAPVLEAGATSMKLQLPLGKWFDFWSNEQYQGRSDLHIPVDLETVPIFIRAGAVIPMQPVMQYTHQKKVDILSLKVYFGEGKTQSTLYEDAGEGYHYQQDIFRLKTFIVEGSENTLCISQQSEGKYTTDYQSYLLRIHALPYTVQEITADGKPLTWKTVEDSLEVEVTAEFNQVMIR